MDRIPAFFYRFLASRMLVSVQMNAFIIFFLWLIVEDYNSVFLAGMTSVVYLAVEIVASIPIGHLIDRVNSTVISAVSSVIAAVGPALLFFGYSLPIIYAATAFITLGLTMKGDSFSATIKKHLSEDQFIAGNSRNQAASFASTLTGTVLGGAAIIFFSGYMSYVLLAISLASIGSSMPIKEKREKPSGGVIKEMAGAIGFYRKILGFVIIAFIINGLFESLDVYSSGLFHIVLKTSPIYYTLFIASISIGGIIGAVPASRMKQRRNSAVIISLMVFLYAPLFLILSINRNPIIDVIDALTIGIFLSLINVPLQSKLMKIIPRNIYGKIMAFLRIFISGSTPVMAVIFSSVSLLDPVNVILFYIGILLFPITILAFAVLPGFMRLETSDSLESVVA
ncbi:MAG: MFS transporter [Thermoplasmataceae archaeon]